MTALLIALAVVAGGALAVIFGVTFWLLWLETSFWTALAAFIGSGLATWVMVAGTAGLIR